MSFDNASTEVVGEHGAIRNDGTFEDDEIYTYSSKWVHYFHRQVLVIEHIGFWLLLSGCVVSSFITESNCPVFIENE